MIDFYARAFGARTSHENDTGLAEVTAASDPVSAAASPRWDDAAGRHGMAVARASSASSSRPAWRSENASMI